MPAPHILADSSIWIDHINMGDEILANLLRRRRILMHPMIFGEVSLGSIAHRKFVLNELKKLPQLPSLSHTEAIAMIEWQELHNCGVGYVDIHLLGATLQVADGRLWTRDKRLRAQAERLGIDANLN